MRTPPPSADPDQPPAFLSRQVGSHRRFHRDPRRLRGRPLAVVCAGWERCARDYVVDRPTFPHLGIELVAAGAGELVLAGERHPLAPGTCFAYGPGVPQRIVADRRQPPLKYFLDLTGSEARRLLGRAGLAPGTALALDEPATALRILDALIDAGRRADRDADECCAHLARALLLTIAGQATPPAVREQPAWRTYARCRRWLELHGAAVPTVAEAARRLDLAPAYLCRLFQRFADETPYGLIQRLRLARAADRLREPGAAVAAVADELGYSNPFHFSRAFKRLYGMPPSDFARLGR